MKTILIILSLFLCIGLYGQSAFTITNSHVDGPAKMSASSFNNPWVGAKLVYNVSGDVSESFLLSARALYIAASGDRWAFPVVGNVGLNQADSLSKDAGVSIGVFPWYSLLSKGSLQLLLHGGLNYHIQDLKQNSYSEFRLLAGLEVALYGKGGTPPTTLSVAPEYIFNSGNETSDGSWGLNITGVVPIANGLGLLLESQVPFDGQLNTGLKIGVIVNGVVD